jgi:DNA-directed RNA polymerase subunit E'/Rpb7
MMKRMRHEKEPSSVYARTMITKQIAIPMKDVGKNVKQWIETYVKKEMEGKCVVEGFVKPNSTQIVSYSSGMVRGSTVLFEVVFECLTCLPVEGMTIRCVAKNITKAGIRAEVADESPSPMVIFVARDHHHTHTSFSQIEENATFVARVIGQRFELNDPFVSVIAELSF